MGAERRHKQQGFTLIELVVVIVIISVIMAVLIPKIIQNSTSGTTKGAATNIIRNAADLSSAASLWVSQKNVEIGTTTGLSDLATANLLTTITPNPSWKDSAFAGTYAYLLDNTTYSTQFGTPAADTVLILDGVTTGVCQSIDVNIGLIVEGSAVPSSVIANQDPQCFLNGSFNRFIKVIYQH